VSMEYDSVEILARAVSAGRDDLDRAWAGGRDLDVLTILGNLGHTDVPIASRSRRPRDAVLAMPVMACLRLYQLARRLSGRSKVCNFAPSCSHYAQGVFLRYPFSDAARLTFHRVVRCDDTETGFDLPDWDFVMELPRE